MELVQFQVVLIRLRDQKLLSARKDSMRMSIRFLITFLMERGKINRRYF